MSFEYQRLRYEAYGVWLDLQYPAQLAAEVGRALPPVVQGLRGIVVPGYLPATRSYRLEFAPRSEWRVMASGVALAASGSLEHCLDALRSDAELWVAASTTTVGFVHAGAVAFGDFGILLPGATHAGKTTLVSALLGAGATYYSDDYAVLDSSGQVWPFPKPLALRAANGSRQLVRPDELGAELGEKGIPVRLILRTGFRSGVTFAPRQLSSGEVALVLLENAPAARLRPAELLQIVSAIGSQAQGYDGDRGEADEVVAFLVARARSSR